MASSNLESLKTRTCLDTSTADHFEKNCSKQRNDSWWAISPFATMFQLLNNYTSMTIWLRYIWLCINIGPTFKLTLLTLSSRRLWKTLWQKEKLIVLSNFFFWHKFFKKPSAAEASESIYMRETVKTIIKILQLEVTGRILPRLHQMFYLYN